MKFINVVPARKSSKGLKNKNLTLINNIKLIEYTFKEIAKGKLKKTFILSDDNKIKKIALKYNLLTDYIRPKKLSFDRTSMTDTLYDFVKWHLKKHGDFEYLVLLQPTSPLRKFKDIKKATEIVNKNKYDSLFSVSESLEHPYESIDIKNFKKGKWRHLFPKAIKYYRRQDFDINSYFINGAIYIIKKELILKKKIYNYNNHGFYIMHKSRSLDINGKEEIILAKKLLK